jgi:hypothetical protein
MEAQAAALRNVVERQGGEVAALWAAAAAAEAQSTAAKVELAKVGSCCSSSCVMLQLQCTSKTVCMLPQRERGCTKELV